MIHVYTSAAPNYLGKVRALFASLREHHPELVLHLALLELDPSISPEEVGADAVAGLRGLGFEHPVWLFQHSLVELSTAIKGAVLDNLLLKRDTDSVIYLDPDVVVFSRLDDVLAALGRGSIVLTPHLVDPESTVEGILDNEMAALRHGVFNLGFLGVSSTPEGRRFAGWWRRRLLQFCRADTASGLFTDQRWIDLAPGYFDEVVILRDSRLNVAPWNVSQRQVSGSFDEGFFVDGRPLGFYHFTGFDSGAHERMLGKYAPYNESLRMLTDWYRRRSTALAEGLSLNWDLGTYEDGATIKPIHRRIYRERGDLRTAFPAPYATGQGTFRSWLELQGPLEYQELASAPQHERMAEAIAVERQRFESSTSWRLTEPLRSASRFLQRLGLRTAT